MMTRGECKTLAKEQLKGGWGQAAILTLIYALLIFAVGLLDFIPILGWVIGILVYPMLLLGYMLYFILNSRREPVEIGTMFSVFRNFKVYWGRTFCALLLIALWILLYSLLGIVLMVLGFLNMDAIQEGYYASAGSVMSASLMLTSGYVLALIGTLLVWLKYGFSFFLLLDFPELRATEALKRSAQLTRGHKGEFFVLYLSFIGWAFLALLTCGIGGLWLQPYIMQTVINFYQSLQYRRVEPEQAGPEVY
ncbi:DUF975 family protein [Clostridium minihomine]|uniref:DUF975 family protein n=1 Tax=Clostridium minihomine TaxID=2045012 RepID=UPI000C76AB97|nr:DUF975 family protein [Clostridium minihomine]